MTIRPLLAVFILLPALSSAAEIPHQIIETYGIGQTNVALSNLAQCKAEAHNEAILKAQARMLTILETRHANGTPPRPELMQSAIQQSAKVVKTDWIDASHCRVILRLNETHYEELTGDQISSEPTETATAALD